MTDHPRRHADPDPDLDHVQATETVHHERHGRRRERGVRQLNLTSMLDVCFQLLIFFILTANFALNEGVLPADLPQGNPPHPVDVPPPEEPLKIVLSLNETDPTKPRLQVWLETVGVIDDPNPLEALYGKLNSWRWDEKTNPSAAYDADNPILIKPQGDVDWGYVVGAFNAVLRAKYTNVSFAPAG